MAAQHLVDPATTIALPGGGQVSAGFLAEQGIYKTDPGSGKVVAPGDAHAVGFGGTTYALAEHAEWFPAFAAPGSTPGETPADAARREAQAQQGRQTSASVQSILRQYDLEELIPEVDTLIRGGLTWPEVEVMLRDPSTNLGKALDAKYPEIRLRTEKGLPPMSVDQIQSYRTQVRQLMRSSGMPEGFYDTDSDFTEYLVGDVSVSELQTRIQDGYVAASQAPPEVKEQLRDYYGVDEGGVAAYFLDPTRAVPIIQRQVASAKIGGAASRVGLDFDRAGSERLYDLNVTETEATRLFGEVAGALPTLQTLQQRFDDPGDPLTAREYAEALVINDPKTLLQVARLVGQQRSLYSNQDLMRRDEQSGGLTGLLDR